MPNCNKSSNWITNSEWIQKKITITWSVYYRDIDWLISACSNQSKTTLSCRPWAAIGVTYLYWSFSLRDLTLAGCHGDSYIYFVPAVRLCQICMWVSGDIDLVHSTHWVHPNTHTLSICKSSHSLTVPKASRIWDLSELSGTCCTWYCPAQVILFE